MFSFWASAGSGWSVRGRSLRRAADGLCEQSLRTESATGSEGTPRVMRLIRCTRRAMGIAVRYSSRRCPWSGPVLCRSPRWSRGWFRSWVPSSWPRCWSRRAPRIRRRRREQRPAPPSRPRLADLALPARTVVDLADVKLVAALDTAGDCDGLLAKLRAVGDAHVGPYGFGYSYSGYGYDGYGVSPVMSRSAEDSSAASGLATGLSKEVAAPCGARGHRHLGVLGHQQPAGGCR